MTFDGRVHCGSRSKRTGDPCRMTKGFRTKHQGAGKCYLHGGNTPSGKKFAATEAAERAVAKLGLPSGTADPFTLLSKAVRHAEGFLEASGHILAQLADKKVDAVSRSGLETVALDLEAAIEMYIRAIREAGRVGKAAVDADVADRMAAVDERLGADIHRILTIALDAAGVTGKARAKAEEALVRELVAAAPSGDERN